MSHSPAIIRRTSKPFYCFHAGRRYFLPGYPQWSLPSLRAEAHSGSWNSRVLILPSKYELVLSRKPALSAARLHRRVYQIRSPRPPDRARSGSDESRTSTANHYHGTVETRTRPGPGRHGRALLRSSSHQKGPRGFDHKPVADGIAPPRAVRFPCCSTRLHRVSWNVCFGHPESRIRLDTKLVGHGGQARARQHMSDFSFPAGLM